VPSSGDPRERISCWVMARAAPIVEHDTSSSGDRDVTSTVCSGAAWGGVRSAVYLVRLEQAELAAEGAQFDPRRFQLSDDLIGRRKLTLERLPPDLQSFSRNPRMRVEVLELRAEAGSGSRNEPPLSCTARCGHERRGTAVPSTAKEAIKRPCRT